MSGSFRLDNLAAMSMGLALTSTGMPVGVRCMAHDPHNTRPSFTTEKPLSKRKRRRLRGKGDTK